MYVPWLLSFKLQTSAFRYIENNYFWKELFRL